MDRLVDTDLVWFMMQPMLVSFFHALRLPPLTTRLLPFMGAQRLWQASLRLDKELFVDWSRGTESCAGVRC